MIQYNYFDLVTFKLQFLLILSVAISTSYGIEMKKYHQISKINWVLIFEDGVFNRLVAFFVSFYFFMNGIIQFYFF